MISKSTITQSDMQAALAYWLNATTMREQIKVVSVKREKSDRYVGDIEHFVADIERDESAAPKITETKP